MASVYEVESTGLFKRKRISRLQDNWLEENEPLKVQYLFTNIVCLKWDNFFKLTRWLIAYATFHSTDWYFETHIFIHEQRRTITKDGEDVKTIMYLLSNEGKFTLLSLLISYAFKIIKWHRIWVSEASFFKFKTFWNSEGWKCLPWGGMDIFWNHTIHVAGGAFDNKFVYDDLAP